MEGVVRKKRRTKQKKLMLIAFSHQMAGDTDRFALKLTSGIDAHGLRFSV